MDENKSLVWHHVNKERPPTDVLLAVVIEGREEDTECTSELARIGPMQCIWQKLTPKEDPFGGSCSGHSPHTPDLWLELPPTS